MNEQRLPSFLIIGAQKSGTTTLYRDLLAHPDITFASVKEAGNLTHESATTPDGRRSYGALYTHAAADQLCGDAATTYSQRPDHEGVAERALDVLGRETRILYIVRNPIERIISHHFHDYRFGRVTPDIDAGVRSDHRYVAYSRYAYQARPWIEAFGADRFLAINFHEYMSARGPSLQQVERFLRVSTGASELDETAHNVSEEARVISTPIWAAVRDSGPYRWLRPRMSSDFRERLGKLLLPAPPRRPDSPMPHTLEFLISELADDIAEQPAILGWECVPWTVGELTREFVESSNPE